MDDVLTQKINSAASVLIIIPTDTDFATIYAGIVMGQAVRNKPVTILNDAVTTNKLLIYKLKNFTFTALHTRALRSFTLTINKESNNVKKSFIDETDEKITLSLETVDGEYDPAHLIELKQSKIDQELVIVLGRQETKFPDKYSRIIQKQPPEKVVYYSSLSTWAGSVFGSFDIKQFDEFSLTLLLASFITETRFLKTNINPSNLDFIKQLLIAGASYSDAFNVATSFVNSDDVGFIIQEVTNSKNMGGGIYYSHVIDINNLYAIKPPYLPSMVHFADCKICFTIISKKNINTVFVVNNKDRFNLESIKTEYDVEGDNTYLYFNSNKETKELEQDLMKRLIQITTNGVGNTQIMASSALDETGHESNKFTQGLENSDPLIPATAIPFPDPSAVNIPTNNDQNTNGNSVKIGEEC